MRRIILKDITGQKVAEQLVDESLKMLTGATPELTHQLEKEVKGTGYYA